MVIGNYCCILMNTNYYGDKNLGRPNCKVLIFVSLTEFQMYVLHIRNDLKDSDRTFDHACIL